MRWYYRGRPSARVTIVWIIGAILPSIAFAIFFASVMPWSAAISAACRGWVNAFSSSLTSDIQVDFLGFDKPLHHLVEHIVATLVACIVIAALAVAAKLGDRIVRRPTLLLAGGLVAAVFASVAWFVHWIEIGRCLIGSNLIYVVVCIWGFRGENGATRSSISVINFTPPGGSRTEPSCIEMSIFFTVLSPNISMRRSFASLVRASWY